MWPTIKDFALKLLRSSASTIVLALCLVIVGYLWLRAPSPPSYTSDPGPVSQGLVVPWVEANVGKETIPPPEKIVRYNKIQLSGELKMPELKLEPGDPVAVVSIPSHTGPTTAIAILDNTGITRVVTRKEPKKFFELKREFRLQGRYLFAGRNLAEADLYANPVRVGPVNLLAGVGAELDREDSSLRGRAFVGFEYRF